MYGQEVARAARLAGAANPSAAEIARTLDWLEHPVFLCGHHRSGTTLLSNLLDGHPELVVLPDEGTYFTSFPYAARADTTPQDVDRFVAEWVVRFVGRSYPPHFKLGRTGDSGNPSVLFARRVLGWQAAVGRAWPERAPMALLLSLVAAFQDVAPLSSRPRRWAEKTPLNEVHVARLAAAFPEARFVQMVREPGATLASLLQLYDSSDLAGEDVAGDARRIGRSLRFARRNMRRLPARYLVVRYEDLAGDTARETDRVRAFLGLAPDPALAIPTVLGRPVRANSSFGSREPGAISRSVQTRALTSREVAYVEAFTASTAPAFGYDAARSATVGRVLLRWRERARRGLRYAKLRLRRWTGSGRSPTP
jgi:hypothetical protein